MNRKTVILIIAIVALSATGVVGIALASTGNPNVVIPAPKQTFIAQEQVGDATSEAAPHAKKIPSAYVIPNSCPNPTPEVGINVFRFGPFPGGWYIVNAAVVESNTGNFYDIWAGAPDNFPQEGLIRTTRLNMNPCSTSEVSAMNDYISPKGPLTIIGIKTDTIEFSIAGGGTGHFNFVTDQFSP